MTHFRRRLDIVNSALIVIAATSASTSALGEDPQAIAALCGAKLTIEQLQQAYESGELTAEALVRGCLERIEQYEPQYNAFISMNAAALDDARRIDRRRRAGDHLGALAGVPVVVKESINVAGLPSTAAWVGPNSRKNTIDLIPHADAAVVTRLRDADAIIIGKGNMPAFSLSPAGADNSWAGRTSNAVDRNLVPGGSSSGVATAVAAGFAIAGVAVESGGSIQNPAAAQALVGVKPSFGLVPTTGLLPLSTSALDVIGPHAKTVADAAVMLNVLAGADRERSVRHGPRDYRAALDTATLRGKRIGLYGAGWGAPALSASTQQLYDAAMRVIEAQGAILVGDPFAGSGFDAITADHPLKPYLYGLESMAYDMNQYFRNSRFGSVDSLRSFIAAAGNPFTQDDLMLGKIWKVVNLRPSGAAHPAMYRLAWKELDAQSNAMTLPTLSTQPPDLSAFKRLQQRFSELFERVMAVHALDLLVFPQTYEPIPSVGSQRVYPVIASPQINLLGLPAVTAPAGYHPAGAPFGLIFIGRKWSEADLLAAAHIYERQTGLRSTPLLVSK